MSAEEAAAAFNDEHRVGVVVKFWPGVRQGPGRVGVTRSLAWVVGDQPVVMVTGYAGGIALSHVEVTE